MKGGRAKMEEAYKSALLRINNHYPDALNEFKIQYKKQQYKNNIF